MASWTSLSTSQKVAVTIGVSAGAAALYICYTKYRNGRALSVVEQESFQLRMKVPRHAIKLLTERETAVKELLGTQTEARIEVGEVHDSNGDQDLTIRGSPTEVRQVQQLVYGMLPDDTVLQVDLRLPARSICRIIGQGGDRIREIRKTSGAKIECERRPENKEVAMATRCITLTGTRQQVEAAKILIQKVSEEEAAIQRRSADSSTFRSRRKEIIAVKKKEKPPPDEVEQTNQRSPCSPQTEESGGDNPPDTNHIADNVCKFEVPSPDFNFQAEEFVDVYVSAVENPEHFWIQILGSRSSQLDKLTTEMSEHYQRQTQGETTEIQVGDIVAAQFHQDQFWYRAEVLGFLENGNVDLYYVDYGDNWETKRESLFPLRSDFLSLPFQAVECSLSDVSPVGGTWSEEALQAFDTLSHCAQWKALLAKISSFPGISRCFQIRLYDPSTDPMTDIGEQLICRGFAVERGVSPMRVEEDESLVCRLLEEVANLPLEADVCSFANREDKRNVSGESIEIMRADVDPSPEHEPGSVSTTSSCLESTEEADNLEQSMAKIQLNTSEHSTVASSSQSTASSTHNDNSCSSSISSTSSTCTASESFVSSSCEDSSVYSPRGCFYHMPDEVSTSSLFTSSSGDVIAISSDSEEEADKVHPGSKKNPKNSDVFLSSASDEVIVVDD